MQLRCRGGGKHQSRHHQCQAANPSSPTTTIFLHSSSSFLVHKSTTGARWDAPARLLCPGAGDAPAGVCGLWCLAAVPGVVCKPLANPRQGAEHQCHQAATACWSLHQESTLELGPSCSSVAPAPDISRDYGDSLSSSGVAVNIGSEGRRKIARGGNHIKYSFPNTLWYYSESSHSARRKKRNARRHLSLPAKLHAAEWLFLDLAFLPVPHSGD